MLVGPIAAGAGIDATLWGTSVIFVAGTVCLLFVREIRELGNGEVLREVVEPLA